MRFLLIFLCLSSCAFGQIDSSIPLRVQPTIDAITTMRRMQALKLARQQEELNRIEIERQKQQLEQEKQAAFAPIAQNVVPAKQITAPSEDAVFVSLKTMHRAFEMCRDVYTEKGSETDIPFLQLASGNEGYAKAFAHLDQGEKIINSMLAEPHPISGALLLIVVGSSNRLLAATNMLSSNLLAVISQPDISTKKGFTPTDATVTFQGLHSCQSALLSVRDLEDLSLLTVSAEENELFQLKYKTK
jgi:hypothetical protein